MQLSDRATGGILLSLGALAAYGGSLLPPVPGQQIGPNVFPMVVGVGLCLCGLMIALGIGRGFEEPEVLTLNPDGSTPEPAPAGPLYGLRVLIPPALLLFYALASERVGFIPTAAAIAFVVSWSLGASLRLAVPVGLVAPVFVHLVFAKLLRVPLPPGLLPMPW